MVNDLNTFRSVLRAAGPAAALGYLNAGAPHRFSAVYRFSGRVLKNVLLHDKRHEAKPDFLSVVPFERSYCQFVQRDRAFRTNDALADHRLAHHPFQGVIVSYHSVPIVSASLELWGTLSHFDMEAMALAEEEFALLTDAAKVFPRYLIA
ncbi:GAF domain-containing protein [Variovorax sp. PAMC 28711]|uniref:GAF domain-containing protein n=1 Tax=Variovorax sp. PAMC 28711 TaxID=1795631 RepID=UPI00078DE9B2|nr:GAF domain-containing protein [Variovorax sp. PAMC 28711]AMM25787.1 hypothetical protein AX767_16575 [Variovorax sp. PAMC 28711]